MTTIIAVNWSDFQKSGCVNCGCEYCYSGPVSGGGSIPVICGECKTSFVILSDSLNQSTIGFGIPAFYPILQEHPRKGIPKHEFILPDIRPETGGEYWAPRGVGYDLAGFVKCRAAGERIIKLVEKILDELPKSKLDYRPNEPNWIQVKIKSEDGFDLQKLNDLCKDDGIITETRLKEALIGEKK